MRKMRKIYYILTIALKFGSNLHDAKLTSPMLPRRINYLNKDFCTPKVDF
jgi:hypothetical protein